MRVADITDVELDLVGVVRVFGLQFVAHIVLLLLIAGEDADLADVGGQEMLEDGVAERAGAAGDHEGGVCKTRHHFDSSLFISCLIYHHLMNL